MNLALRPACWLMLFVACWVHLPMAHAAQDSWLVGPVFSASEDSDGLRVQRRGFALANRFEHGWAWRGVEATHTQYSDRTSELQTSALNWVSHHLDPLTGHGEQIKLGISKGQAKNLLSLDASLSRPLGVGSSWSIFANQDWVDSAAAIRRDTSFVMGGGSMEWRFAENWTQVALASFTRYSDGAARNQQRFRWIWDAWPEQGINLQASLRFQQGRAKTSDTVYFNPDRFNDALLHMGWRRRLEEWMISGRVGAGRQRVGTEPLSWASQAEMNLMRRLGPQEHFSLRLTNQSSAGINGSGYRYELLELIWLFRLP